MKILVLSDLHFDFRDEMDLIPLANTLETVDALIIAGDLTNKPKVRWKHAINWLTRFLPQQHVFVFPGNHDYYDFCLDNNDRLKTIAHQCGVNFAQQKEIVFENTRFLCATLWTNLELDRPFHHNKISVETLMNDYRYIRLEKKSYRRIQAEDTKIAHQNDLKWLDNALNTPFDGTTIVVTHHAPHPNAINPAKRHTPHAPAYASDLTPFLEKHKNNANIWLYGHTHYPLTFACKNWILHSISLGYPQEKPNLDILNTFIIDTKNTQKQGHILQKPHNNAI